MPRQRELCSAGRENIADRQTIASELFLEISPPSRGTPGTADPDVAAPAATGALGEPAIHRSIGWRQPRLRMWDVQFVESGKKCRRVLAGGDRIRRAAEKSKALCQSRYQPGFVFETGTENEPDRRDARGRGERIESGDNGLCREASLHGAVDDDKTGGRIARIEIAECIDDQRLVTGTPGGLRKRPPGECSDQDRLAHRTLSEADELFRERISMAEVEHQRLV